MKLISIIFLMGYIYSQASTMIISDIDFTNQEYIYNDVKIR
jgi:hypothetical protein